MRFVHVPQRGMAFHLVWRISEGKLGGGGGGRIWITVPSIATNTYELIIPWNMWLEYCRCFPKGQCHLVTGLGGTNFQLPFLRSEQIPVSWLLCLECVCRGYQARVTNQRCSYLPRGVTSPGNRKILKLNLNCCSFDRSKHELLFFAVEYCCENKKYILSYIGDSVAWYQVSGEYSKTDLNYCSFDRNKIPVSYYSLRSNYECDTLILFEKEES